MAGTQGVVVPEQSLTQWAIAASASVLPSVRSSFRLPLLLLAASQPWLPDGYSQIFRIACGWPFGLEGLWLRYAALLNFLSLDCARVEGVGSNFAIWQHWYTMHG